MRRTKPEDIPELKAKRDEASVKIEDNKDSILTREMWEANNHA